MVNDTMPIKAITEMIGATVGFENAIGAESVTALANGLFFSIFIFSLSHFCLTHFFFILFSTADILLPEQTLGEKGFVGDIVCGLFSQVGTDGLYSQLPFHEGKLFRKKATSLRGLKSSLANWVRRWYVLRKNQFAYFKSREDDRPLGFINLNQTKSIRKIKQSETELLKDIPPKYKGLCFAVDTSERIYVFLTDSPEEVAAWMNHLELARRLFSQYELTESFERAKRAAIKALVSPAPSPSRSSSAASDKRALSTKDF